MTKNDRVTGSSSKSDPHESEYRASAVTKCKDIISVKGDVRILREGRDRGGRGKILACERKRDRTIFGIHIYMYTHNMYIYIYIAS